jgi:endonuclease/exonuclease/phosphatase family metal-dependent hydrolase
MYSKLFFLSIFILFAGCKGKTDKILSVSTFNIRWLGDGENDRVDRSEEEYKLIAEVILDTDSDILALQEIENENALKKIMTHLPDWKYAIEDDGYVLNLAYIYKPEVELQNLGLYKPIKVVENRTRSGLIAKAKKGNFDFYLMNLHFKASSRYDNTPEKKKRSFELRQKQSAALSKWIDSILTFNEQDLIILGDYNDNPKRDWSDNLRPLKDNDNIKFISSDLESCKNPNWDNIDHIVVSNSAHNRYIMGSVGMQNIYAAFPQNEAEKISDHCPVTAVFEVVSDDND